MGLPADRDFLAQHKGCRPTWRTWQGLLVFPLFDLFRLYDVPGQNDLLENSIKLSPENPRSPEN